MSVINSMLRDLDERQRGLVPGGASLPSEVRATHSPSPRVRPVVFIGALMVGAAMVAGGYFYSAPKPARVPAPVSMESPPIVPIVRDETPQQSLPLAQQTLSHETTRAVPSKETSPAMADALLQLSSVLSTEVHATAAGTASASSHPANRKPVVSSPVLESPAPLALASPSPTLARSDIVVEQTIMPAQERLQNDVQRAAELQRRGSLAEAETVLRGALAEDRNMVVARQALIALLTRQQREDEVRKLLQEGVALTPTQPQLVLQYARLLAGRGEWPAAAEVLAPAATALARDPEFRALNGAVLQHLGRFKPSVDEYQAALRIAPDVAAWWVGLGLSLESDGRLAEARGAYQQARQHETLTPDLQQFVDGKLARLP